MSCDRHRLLATSTSLPPNRNALHSRAAALHLPGLIAHWDELQGAQLDWVSTLISWEESERNRRGLERRLLHAHLGRFKSLADFDWNWPERCDQAAVSDMMKLNFISDATNLILVGNNGLGKSTIAQNIARQAVLHGHSALFVNAAQMLGDLADVTATAPSTVDSNTTPGPICW